MEQNYEINIKCKNDNISKGKLPLIISRIILALGIFTLVVGIINYVMLSIEWCDVPTNLLDEYEHISNSMKIYSLVMQIGCICLIIGLCISLILERQRFMHNNYTVSQKSFFKNIFCRYFTLVFVPFVLFMPFTGVVNMVMALVSPHLFENYAEYFILVLYAIFISIFMIVLFKKIDSLYIKH